MQEASDFKKFLPSILAYILKTIWLTIAIVLQLIRVEVPDVIIVQNPPSIPTLPAVYFYKLIFGSKLIVDWHNYGFSILSLSLRPSHPLVRWMRFIEIRFGRLADAGFCVSQAMHQDLRHNYRISYPLYVLYDKPPTHFKPLSWSEKHEFFTRMQSEIAAFRSPDLNEFAKSDAPPGNRFTTIEHSGIVPRSNRPALLLSSTSWTEDEDFGLLLDAIERYDEYFEKEKHSNNKLPSLVCVITGKGPLKQYYETQIDNMHLKHVEFALPWLSAEDYAKMVASCDLGICLHTSSSGVDLPMKVVDLFGCGIPVLALKYKAINELVKEEVYGLTFDDSRDLFHKLTELLRGFGKERQSHDRKISIDRFRENITKIFLKSRWETNWKQVAKPVIDELAGEG